MCDLEEKIIRLLSSPHYQRLSTFSPPFDPLNVLGIPHRELSFSSVLKWLLTEPENKNFRHKFLLWIKKNLKLDGDFPIDQKIGVKREYGDSEAGRLDVFVQLESPETVLGIEIKVKADEGHQQIFRYQQFLDRQYPNSRNKAVVYITPLGRPPTTARDLPEVPVLNMSWKWIADKLDQCKGHGEMHNFRVQFAQHIRRSVLMQKDERQIVVDLLREGDNARTIRRIIDHMPDLGEKKYRDRYMRIVAKVLEMDTTDLELSAYPDPEKNRGNGTRELKVRIKKWNDAGLPFTLMLYNYEKLAVRVLMWSENLERHKHSLTKFLDMSEGYIGNFPRISGWNVWRSVIASDGTQWVPHESKIDYEFFHKEFWNDVERKLGRQMRELLPVIQRHIAMRQE